MLPGSPGESVSVGPDAPGLTAAYIGMRGELAAYHGSSVARARGNARCRICPGYASEPAKGCAAGQDPCRSHRCLSDQSHQSAGSHFRSSPRSGCA